MKIILLVCMVISIYAQEIISPLGLAIINKDTKLAKELISNGADLIVLENEHSIRKIVTPSVRVTYVGGMDTQVYPLVILAATNGMDEVIKLMKSKDEKSVYLKDRDGNDALMWASRQGHLSTVKLLLKYGFNPLYKAPTHKDTAYELALMKDKYKIVSLFLEVLYKQKNIKELEYTIWRLARHDTDIIEKLLKLGVKDNYKGIAPRTSLMKAAEVGKLETMKLLLKYGSDPYESNQGSVRYGYDPMTSAINSGRDDVVRFLFQNYDYDLSKMFDVKNTKASVLQKVLSTKYGMKINEEVVGDNYLHIAYSYYKRPTKEIFLLVLQKSKLDINSLNKNKKSLLQVAVSRADVEYVKFFLEIGLSEKTIQEAKKTAIRFLDIYTKQYKQVENMHNLKNMKNAQIVYDLIEEKI